VARWWIGTSGFSYPHWRGLLYPEGLPRRRWLERYAEVFPAVELNVTFYRLPREEAFRGWAATVPEGFRFVLKAPRVVTHVNRLAGCREPLERFRDRAALLGKRLGPVLLQLPPGLAFDSVLLDAFLEQVPEGLPPLAWEPRHRSFAAPEAAAWFEARGQTAVYADSGGRYPTLRVPTGPALYLRLHGPERLYASAYGEARLRHFAEWGEAHARGREVWCFFNNDVGGHAVRDAAALARLVGVSLSATLPP